jgi:hypothetical protein
MGKPEYTVSRAVHSVCNALVRRSHRFIKFPIAQGIQENKRKFYDIGNFPNIFGLIDGTYVRIIAPSLLNALCDRKFYEPVRASN